jgi:hypothetical protein
MNFAPIIVIGMHRSGTTMLSQQMEGLGIFMGKRKEMNHESTLFLGIDNWIASQCGASWENPQPIHYLIGNRELRARVADYIDRYLLRTPRAMEYLGLGKYLRYRSPFELDIPWGWKSPLSTFTFPIWLDLFPNAKVIHIYRHGVDVANSLRSRGRRESKPSWKQQLYYKLPILHALRPKTGEFVRVRCDSLDGGLSLWEEYIAEARNHVAALGERSLEIKYEDVLANPVEALRVVSQFCGLEVSDASIQDVASLVRRERAYAFQDNSELQAFAARVPERLSTHGY